MKTSVLLKRLTENISKDGLITFAVFGSQPTNLVAGLDVDLVLLISADKKDFFLDDLMLLLNSILPSDVEYSLINGPYKVQNKGLLHFHIYTDKKANVPTDIWSEEHCSIRKSIIKNHTLLYGEKLTADCVETISMDKEKWYQDKVSALKKSRAIVARNWYKEKETWLVERKPILLSDWQIEKLLKYYAKYR